MTTIRIRVTQGNGHTEEHNVEDGEFILGSKDADLILNDPEIAPQHAALRVGPSGVTLVSFPSAGGTFTETGERIVEPLVLSVGQTLQLGQAHLKLLFRRSFIASAPLPSAHKKPRGKILKIPDQSPGLIFCEGKQYEFQLRGVWQSPIAPTVNQTVEMDIGALDVVERISVIDQKEVARETFEQLGMVAQERAKVAKDAVLRSADALRTGDPKTKKAVYYGGGAVVGLGVLYALGSGLGLFGGLSKSSLKSSINANLEEEGPLCLSFADMQKAVFPGQFGPQIATQPIFKGLLNGGYVTAERVGQLPRLAWGDPRNLVVDLTEKGRSADVWDRERGFCVGQKEVVEVLKWTDPEMGRGTIGIEYKWRVDPADWVNPKDFEHIPGMTKEESGYTHATKTSDGWVTR